MRGGWQPLRGMFWLLHTPLRLRLREPGCTLLQELCYSLSIPEGIIISTVVRALSALREGKRWLTTAIGEHQAKLCTLPTALRARAGSFENIQTVNPLSHIILIDWHFGNIIQPGSLHPTSSLQSHHKSSQACSIFHIPSRFLGFAFIFISKTSHKAPLKGGWNLLLRSTACIFVYQCWPHSQETACDH